MSFRQKFIELVESIRSSPRTIFWVVMIAVFIDGIFYSIIIPILPSYGKEYDISQEWLGVLYAAYFGASLISTPISGIISDRIGRKKPMILGLLFFLLSTLLFAFVNNYWLMCLARVFQGFCSGVTWTISLCLIADIYPNDQQGTITGQVMTSVGVGILIGPFIGGSLFELTGSKKIPFLIMCIFILIETIARSLIKDPLKKEKKGDGDWQSMKKLFGDVQLWMHNGCAFIAEGLLSGLEPVVPMILSAEYDISPFWLGLIWMLVPIAFGGSSPIIGKLSDKYPSRREYLMFLGMIVTAIFLPFLAIHNIYIVAVLLFFAGITCNLILVPQLPMINLIVDTRFGGQYYGAANSLNTSCYSIGSFVGPLLLSTLYGQFGPLVCFLSSAIILFIYSIIFIVVVRKYSIQQIKSSEESEELIEKEQDEPNHFTIGEEENSDV